MTNGHPFVDALADAYEPVFTRTPVFDNNRDAVVGSILQHVTHAVTKLMASSDRPPSVLKLHAGEVSVELHWPEHDVTTAPDPAAQPPAVEPAWPGSPASADPGTWRIGAPTVGVFYRAPSPGAAPFVREGDTVAAGQQVGIVEIMKLLIPVEADRPGTVVKVLKADADPVEHGEPLFELAAP